VVVGTDGSDSSLRAVDRAGAIAADHVTKLIVATAHPPARKEHGGWSVPPGSAPEESGGGTINYSDADVGKWFPNSASPRQVFEK
jgi:nucleotide-binding universal stress UspA family protein